jgi:type IV pilus assembly protein PilB
LLFRQRKSLEDFIVEKNLLSRNDLNIFIDDCKKSGESLKKSLIGKGVLSEEDIANYYEKELKIPRANLSTYSIDSKILELVSETFARKNTLIPLVKNGDIITVAMADPLNIIVLDELKLKTGCTIESAFETEANILDAINHYYGTAGGSIEDVIKSMDEEIVQVGNEYQDEEIDAVQLQNMAAEAPIIKLVNAIIMQAIHEGSSDIHIEPSENSLEVRNRIDGILHDAAKIPKHLQAAVISRIKIISDMNIALKRSPQDGRFQIKIGKSPIDFRVSTFPTIYGENVVMRILDPSSIMIGLENLGFSQHNFDQFKDLINRPHGIILVTGPTGSGKTTTLYAALNSINSPEKNIITVEDPVEYRLHGIRQSQINPKAGLTFASGLRSILRQDPDIIMVGEIRDLETAEIAIQAALTGHLVLSTLHTNDAPGALTRLTDMGVEPFLISSSVVGVLAQRLVRTICPSCRSEEHIDLEALKRLGINFLPDNFKLFKGKGCKSCKNTGYKGRIGIYELMLLDDAIRDAILNHSSSSAVRKIAQEKGMKSLREDGMEKVGRGITSIDEVIRVTSIE